MVATVGKLTDPVVIRIESHLEQGDDLDHSDQRGYH